MSGDVLPGDTLVFTVIGTNPYERQVDGASLDANYIKPETSIIAWGEYRPLAWRQNGPRTTFMITGSVPSRGFVVEQADGTYTGEILEGQALTVDAINAQRMIDSQTDC